MESTQNAVLTFSESHPYVLLGIVAILAILVIFMFCRQYFSGQPRKGRRAGASCGGTDDSDEEIDSLIAAIHNKQNN